MPTSLRTAIPALGIAGLVAIVDTAILPVLLASAYRGATPAYVCAFDFGIVAIAGLSGAFFAARVGLPLWWRPCDGSKGSRRETAAVLALGLLVVLGNTLVLLASPDQLARVAPWLLQLTPTSAVLLAARAALTENVVFRLLLFSLAVWVARRARLGTRAGLFAGAAVSALAFALIHPGGGVALLAGLALAYVFARRGLLAAMGVQFLGDAVPFLILAARP